MQSQWHVGNPDRGPRVQFTRLWKPEDSTFSQIAEYLSFDSLIVDFCDVDHVVLLYSLHNQGIVNGVLSDVSHLAPLWLLANSRGVLIIG